MDFCIFSSRRKPFRRNLPAGFSERVFLTPPHNRFEELFLPIEVRKVGCDLVHAIDFYSPLRKSVPQILSIYDLYFLQTPDCMDAASYKHYRKLLSYVDEAAHVVCSSEATKKDLLELTAIDSGKVSVIYPGPTQLETKGELREELRPLMGKPYFLFVGTIEPRKNLVRLFEAYRVVKKRLGDSCPTLLLAGAKSFAGERILGEIERLGIEDGVKFVERPSDAELARLYRDCEFVAYPSLYEGFGFPLLEAMAAGKAILSSNVSSIPEVTGEAALLIDPVNAESIEDGLLRLIQEPELRKKLQNSGGRQLAKFSWRAAAKEMLSLYSRVLA